MHWFPEQVPLRDEVSGHQRVVEEGREGVMFKRPMAVFLALGLVAVAGQAYASVPVWWAVDWAGVQRIDYELANYNSGEDRSAYIGGAAGREYATQFTSAYTQYQPVFCVDLFNFASDSWSGRYNVDRHDAADGIAGWLTPAGDSDEYRDAGGLTRAAALAWKFGRVGSSAPGSILLGTPGADQNNRAIALNVAIWQAAYGSNFALRGPTGNMTANQWTYYSTYYLPYYNSGATSNSYVWWDSRVNDGTSTNQDFLTGVPEPSSMILLGGLLAGSALVALRRRKQTA